jgi:hypothetical protein
MLGQAARWFLANKGNGLSVSSEDREQLESLANAAPDLTASAAK